ncbi:iron export ABC transporter permease subunit FetB [Desemzia sp. RIT804]|uniref:ABC transporter permease n=1 Tax=Desemzia sp. RIT 804 TaxID=2810209 RepID=UPI00195066A3|nr:iron export ABC transporter permease subunit FetB [Desemzia sp. RIT 804]MBM6615140.1 iron export ABC transporter permease subunit FetB [Desemzia sp. RIT 804]
MDLQVSPITLVLSFVLVLFAMFISYKEKLGTAKEILYSVIRAVIQLVIVGYVLTYLFGLDNPIVTIGLILVISFNAAWNAHKRSNNIPNSLKISMTAIFSTIILTLSILVLSGSIEFIPSQIVPISGMICGSAMTTIGLCYRNLNALFRDQRQQVLEKLSLGATPNQASRPILRDTIKSGMQPALDSAKTIGIVTLPGMMSGLMFAGTVPMTAIMYQIMVTFMVVATSSISSYIASFLAYRSFFNDRQQFLA